MNSGEESTASSPSTTSTSTSPPPNIRRGSFLSSLLGRSLSIPYDSNDTISSVTGERECEIASNNDNADGKQAALRKLRSKSLSSSDEDSNPAGNDNTSKPEYRPRTLSSVLLGTKKLSMDDGKVLLSQVDGAGGDITGGDKMETNDDVFPQNSPLSNSASSDAPREISQTDHLNRKLLGSFLERINSMATSFIDPSGNGQTLGQVYTNDVMMDRIIRRVESDSNENP